jgi:hypothetical protein
MLLQEGANPQLGSTDRSPLAEINKHNERLMESLVETMIVRGGQSHDLTSQERENKVVNLNTRLNELDELKKQLQEKTVQLKPDNCTIF